MGNILAFSGKKQSGKNTSANFLFGIEMFALGMTDAAHIDEKGRLMVWSQFDNEKYGWGEFKPDDKRVEVQQYLSENIWPIIKLYSFADWLKIIAIKVLGLKHEQVYGTDEEKDSYTKLKWEDMPGVITSMDAVQEYENITNKFIHHEPGFMTSREVLQFMGTEIFRKMYYDVWVESCINQIKEENVGLAVITDCRFPNEVDGIHKAGGKVIRLTREINPNDKHLSETALNPNKFDWNKFDYVIDNSKMTIPEQNENIFRKLMEWGYIGDMEKDIYSKHDLKNPK